jgi:hypothetical protein
MIGLDEKIWLFVIINNFEVERMKMKFTNLVLPLEKNSRR